MRIKIKKIDPTLDLPVYKTAGSVAFDIAARIETVILPHQTALIPSNLIIQVPDGYLLLLALRSSTPLRKGLLMPNGVGIIDQDYCGPDDEIKIMVYNFNDASVTIEKGERIAQGVFLKIDKNFEWLETNQINPANRGGFGSTGE